jgi:hypothetical protein
MYCTIEDIRVLLPYNVTIGDTNIGTPSPGQPTTKRDKLTPQEVTKFIRFAQQEIDSRLKPMYVTPLRRIKDYETEILNNVSSGSNVMISVNDSGAFATGQLVRIQKTHGYEQTVVTNVPDLKRLEVSILASDYDADSTVSILEFPDPIPLICARLAVSYAFDQLFIAEQAPDVSQYGINQRKLAMNSMDSILSGTAILVGQDHVTKRFARMSVFDSYKTPTDDIQFGRESQ